MNSEKIEEIKEILNGLEGKSPTGAFTVLVNNFGELSINAQGKSGKFIILPINLVWLHKKISDKTLNVECNWYYLAVIEGFIKE